MASVQVASVEQVQATIFDLIDRRPLYVGAIGSVSTGGYSAATLTAHRYIDAPADGILDLDFVAEPPAVGVAIQVRLPISALYEGEARDWVRGVRIHTATNELEATAISTLDKPKA